MDIIVNILSMTIPFSVALLLASLGEMFNQSSGVQVQAAALRSNYHRELDDDQ